MNPTDITLSERSQMEKEYILCDLPKFRHNQNLLVVLSTRIMAALAGVMVRSKDKGSTLGASNILILNLGAVT